jgi:flagellin-like hook-associated protein FlgL
MSVINTNIGALRAANASTKADKALGVAMERLSTGSVSTARRTMPPASPSAPR